MDWQRKGEGEEGQENGIPSAAENAYVKISGGKGWPWPSSKLGWKGCRNLKAVDEAQVNQR